MQATRLIEVQTMEKKLSSTTVNILGYFQLLIDSYILNKSLQLSKNIICNGHIIKIINISRNECPQLWAIIYHSLCNIIKQPLSNALKCLFLPSKTEVCPPKR